MGNSAKQNLFSRLIVPLFSLGVLAFYHLGTILVVDTKLSYLLIGPVSVLIVISSLLAIYREAKEWSQSRPNEEFDSQSMPFIESVKLLAHNKSFMIIPFTILYIVLLPYIGTFITTILVPLLMMYFMGMRNRKQLIAVPLGLALFVTGLFQIALNIPLPWGVLKAFEYLF